MSGRLAPMTFSRVASSRLQDSGENVSINEKKKNERCEKLGEDCRRFLLARFYAAWALFLLLWLFSYLVTNRGLAHTI